KSFLTISATDILVPACSKTPLLYLLTQKVAQKFGYVLGIGDGRRELLAIRRFHSLRSFHQRLFTFAPFGDGRHELPAFSDSSGTADMSFRHFLILRGRQT
ncbi:hypothetical protein, partial [Segatella copri]|uniref:hypothetical protein n=1 Tax=Segatella copri TaxID=165179 RepID=UPI001EE3FD11